MKELNKFRNFLNEGKFEIGDKVTMKGGGDEMEIMKSRRMFGSDINAYTVKNVGGDEYEYDESQLKLAESEYKNDYANSEEDYTDSMVIEKIKDIIKYHELDPSDVLEEIGQEFGIAFEFGRGQ